MDGWNKALKKVGSVNGTPCLWICLDATKYNGGIIDYVRLKLSEILLSKFFMKKGDE